MYFDIRDFNVYQQILILRTIQWGYEPPWMARFGFGMLIGNQQKRAWWILFTNGIQCGYNRTSAWLVHGFNMFQQIYEIRQICSLFKREKLDDPNEYLNHEVLTKICEIPWYPLWVTSIPNVYGLNCMIVRSTWTIASLNMHFSSPNPLFRWLNPEYW